MGHNIAEWLVAVISSAGACLVLVFAHRWYRLATDDRSRWHTVERMPLVLRGAELFMSEQDICMESPVALRGRVDQVFLTKNRLLILVDTKTRDRHRVYSSDVWQLAVYAAILDVTAAHHVASYAFIRTVIRTETSRDVRYHAVRLPSFRDTIRLAAPATTK